MKKGAIDIGTNSTRLFIADVKNKRIEPIIRLTTITRLGDKVNTTKKLNAAAVKRTIKTLKEYKRMLDVENIKSVRAVATSAVRDATNRDKFIEKVASECGITVEVLSGLEEAALSYTGATADDKLSGLAGFFLVIDIGGGSTELIAGRSGKLLNAKSIDIGSVRLSEVFLKNDPPKAAEIAALRSFVSDSLSDIYPGGQLIGIDRSDMLAIAVAGTSTSLVAIEKEMVPYNPDLIHGALFSRERTEYTLLKLSKLTLEKLRILPGLDPNRADVIIAGAAIQAEIMNFFKLDKVRVSERDILDGILLTKRSRVVNVRRSKQQTARSK